MGSAIVRRLAGAGHRVVVWNRTPGPAVALAEAAPADLVRAGTTAAATVAGAEVVLSMLASGDATCTVLLDSAVLEAVASTAVVVDLATSGIDAARRLAEGFAAAGRRYVDAPVSGSVPAVEAGTLLVMASGKPADIDLARPVLDILAHTVLDLGPTGNGQAMKLAVNLVVHELNSALSEALALAERLGIPIERAYDVLERSVVAAPFVGYKRAAFLDPTTPVAMSLQLVAKDLSLITAAADGAGIALPGTHAVRTQVDEACAAGYGSADMAGLNRFLRE